MCLSRACSVGARARVSQACIAPVRRRLRGGAGRDGCGGAADDVPRRAAHAREQRLRAAAARARGLRIANNTHNRHNRHNRWPHRSQWSHPDGRSTVSHRHNACHQQQQQRRYRRCPDRRHRRRRGGRGCGGGARGRAVCGAAAAARGLAGGGPAAARRPRQQPIVRGCLRGARLRDPRGGAQHASPRHQRRARSRSRTGRRLAAAHVCAQLHQAVLGCGCRAGRRCRRQCSGAVTGHDVAPAAAAHAAAQHARLGPAAAARRQGHAARAAHARARLQGVLRAPCLAPSLLCPSCPPHPASCRPSHPARPLPSLL
jgi:hypothetical protein